MKILENTRRGDEIKKVCAKSLNSAPCNAGFTLIEVLVAFAIVSIAFVMIMQLFAGGLRASRTSCDYTVAIVHAKDKMEELSGKLEEESGEFEDGFKWQTWVQAYKEPEGALYKLMEIKVIISWPETIDRNRTIELVSLKAVGNEGS